MRYHCDLSPLNGAYCPYCTDDGPLCDFDKCDIEEAYEASDDDKIMQIHKRILEERLKESCDKVYAETSIVREPVDYIGIGTNTKGMPLRKALNEAYKELKELNNEGIDN